MFAGVIVSDRLGAPEVLPIPAPVLIRASGVIKPHSIAGEPNAVCRRCTRFGAALPAALLLATRQIARC